MNIKEILGLTERRKKILLFWVLFFSFALFTAIAGLNFAINTEQSKIHIFNSNNSYYTSFINDEDVYYSGFSNHGEVNVYEDFWPLTKFTSERVDNSHERKYNIFRTFYHGIFFSFGYSEFFFYNILILIILYFTKKKQNV